MILTGNEIKRQRKEGRLFITPWHEERVGANSYDVSLGDRIFQVRQRVLDVKKPVALDEIVLTNDGYCLEPGELYLGYTVEETESPFHVPMYEGRSTMARYGVTSHLSAGFGDIGFKGRWTLEITVVKPTFIYPNMRVGQVFFLNPYGNIETRYAGGYSGHLTAAGPRPNNI
jgi:deoxycytidine triphosphate deaminase